MSQLSTKADIIAFLKTHGYRIMEEDSILVIQDEDGLHIFAAIDEPQIEFMVDVCRVAELDTEKLEEIYEKILAENTEILPSCFGIDSGDAADKHIVLVDSLALENLDENELLLTLDSFAVNALTARNLLLPYFDFGKLTSQYLGNNRTATA